MRTESRVIPRYSGGEGASSSDGKVNVSGCSSGREGRGPVILVTSAPEPRALSVAAAVAVPGGVMPALRHR